MKTRRPVSFIVLLLLSLFFLATHLYSVPYPVLFNAWGRGSREGERIPQTKTGRWSCGAPGILVAKETE
jgi:hypothetical protein